MAENLTITRDLIFGHVINKKENCKKLLQLVFPKRDISNIKVIPQKEVNEHLNEKNVRFDIWAVDQNDLRYDLEMQLRNEHNLGARSGYYLKALLEETLPPGGDYRDLKTAYVIFFCCYDPFGFGQYKYHFQMEEKFIPGLNLETKGEVIILNSKGYHGKINSELKDFLDFMNGKKNLKNPFIAKLDQEIKTYISSPEWRKMQMNLAVKLADERYDTRVEAIKKWIKANREIGIPDEKTLDMIYSQYHDHFTKDDLQQIFTEA